MATIVKVSFHDEEIDDFPHGCTARLRAMTQLAVYTYDTNGELKKGTSSIELPRNTLVTVLDQMVIQCLGDTHHTDPNVLPERYARCRTKDVTFKITMLQALSPRGLHVLRATQLKKIKQ